MKKSAILPLCLGCVFTVSNSHAMDLKQSKLTQVVNDVSIISATDQQQKAASVNDVFSMPDILRTGPASRAELVAADETVTRVGANTIFSFDPANRTIDLKQGSLLFHSPHGMGGGTIHTGSATASVLGTTLIVTTTPSGGMKVLDLEGQVEVKFLNGLKQNLAPGHMTFVLPGGSQLAPIIVFRLDDVTKKGLLVGGFNQNLASMPLIEQQINKQLKAIQNGKLSDTGLVVGDDASSQSVQVLDLNTLQADLDGALVNSAAVRAAFASDAIINAPSLTDVSIPTPPERVFLSSLNHPGAPPDAPFLLSGNAFFNATPFQGFAARNITFNTVHLNPLTVDLSPYGTAPEFDFVAMGNLSFDGPVTFSGLSSDFNAVFSLVAGNQILVTPGSKIVASTVNFDWSSAGAFTLDNSTIQNLNGNTSFTMGGDFTLQNNANIMTPANLSVLSAGNIAINNSTVSADSLLLTSAHGTVGLDSAKVYLNNGYVTAKQTLTVNNTVFNASTEGGTASFFSQSGSVNVTGTSIQAQTLSLQSGDGILLDGNGQTFTSAGESSTANFTAKNLADLRNTDLTQFKNVNIAANTINLHDMSFDGLVKLMSLYGKWNNTTSKFGYVNDLGGNTWHGQALTAANEFSGTIAGTGVTISTR